MEENSAFYVGQTVRYKHPREGGEEGLRFTVQEIHPSDGKIPEKLHTVLHCSWNIKPTFCEFSSEYEPDL